MYFGTSFINAAVSDPTVNEGAKNFASLLTTVAVSRGANNLGLFETSGVGLQNNNIMTLYQNYAIGKGLIVMTISLFLFMFAGLYLDNVLPSAYGLRKPWYYCLTPTFWFGSDDDMKDSPRKHQIDDEKNSANDGQIDEFFEAKDMNPLNFEPVQKEFMKQETDKKILKVSNLRKTFDNGFKAV